MKRTSPKVQPKHGEGTRPGNQPNPITEFVRGVGEGLYDVGKGTAVGVHAALTTNPVTTVRNAGCGIAGMIDAQPGRASTLMRTMADGSKRPVKFDGIRGDYVINREWSVRDMPGARAQLLRQSQVLAEHRLIGTWEVPTPVQKIRALKLLKKTNVTNIHVKAVKP